MQRVQRLTQHLVPTLAQPVSVQPCAQRGSGRLQGRACVITGAASGIGRSAAVLFAKEGANLICADWNQEGVEETVQIVQKECKGAKAVAMKADCGSEQANADMVAECVKQFGRLDVFFANAGVGGSGLTFDEISEQSLLDTFRINTFGVMYAVKHASEQMRKQGSGGSIIATSSVAGIAANAGPMPYSASKAAVISIVKTASLALTGTKIRVNAICPGLVPTGMTQPLFDLAEAKGTSHKIGQLNPLKRPGTAIEVANAALFLASEESSYIVGQALPVCGGLSASLPFVPGGVAMKPATGTKP